MAKRRIEGNFGNSVANDYSSYNMLFGDNGVGPEMANLMSRVHATVISMGTLAEQWNDQIFNHFCIDDAQLYRVISNPQFNRGIFYMRFNNWVNSSWHRDCIGEVPMLGGNKIQPDYVVIDTRVSNKIFFVEHKMGTEFDTGKLRSIKGYLEQIKGFYENQNFLKFKQFEINTVLSTINAADIELIKKGTKNTMPIEKWTGRTSVWKMSSFCEFLGVEFKLENQIRQLQENNQKLVLEVVREIVSAK
jgi:hypothetical protein